VEEDDDDDDDDSAVMASSRDRQLLRDLNRLDRRREAEAAERRREAEATDNTTDDEGRRQRLQRVLARLSRLDETRPSYGVPPTQQQQQSLYDWAPTNNDDDDNEEEEGEEQGSDDFAPLDPAIAQRRALSRRQDSLRSTAIMHNARASVRSPSAALRHSDTTQDSRSAYRRTYLADTPPADPSPSTPLSRILPMLESAVKYLDEVRACSTYDESICVALDHSLYAPECYDDLITDTATCRPPPPSSWLAPGAIFRGTQHTTTPPKEVRVSTRPSTTFDATRPHFGLPTSYSRSMPPPLPDSTLSYLQLPPRDVPDRWPVKVTVQAVDDMNKTMAGTMEAFDVPNTPCAPMGTCTSTPPITTYLEGQIIDLDKHSFLTPSHNADSVAAGPSIKFPPTSATTDAAYWRNLPPFSSMKSDQDVARAMLSRMQMDEIMSEWIFMRWKERCFIHSESDVCHDRYNNNNNNNEHSGVMGEGDDTHSGHGLTISGFYYVSLRRSDGCIDGLYFDTKTSPYQHLRLGAISGGTLGSWQFK
jgi:hypothetical protein